MCAPSRCSSSSARCSVLFVYVVVRIRKDLPASQCRRSASASGRTPLHRTKAMTTSIASADGTSARSSCPTAGSPGAFVNTVVSSRGVSGRAIDCGCPSGSLCSRATKTRPGSSGSSPRTSFRSSVTDSRRLISSAAIRTASSLRFPSGARSIALARMLAKWRDMRSEASASRSSATSASSLSSGSLASTSSSRRVRSASWSPGFRASWVTLREFLSPCPFRQSWSPFRPRFLPVGLGRAGE